MTYIPFTVETMKEFLRKIDWKLDCLVGKRARVVEHIEQLEARTDDFICLDKVTALNLKAETEVQIDDGWKDKYITIRESLERIHKMHQIEMSMYYAQLEEMDIKIFNLRLVKDELEFWGDEDEREFLQEFYVNGSTYEETAEKLGVSRTCVYKRSVAVLKKFVDQCNAAGASMA